jgi:hypothetical protein
VLASVRRRSAAEGTAQEAEAVDKCGEIMCRARRRYEETVRGRLSKMKPNDKQWWSLARQLLRKKTRVGSIPALRDEGSEWLFSAKAKADRLASVFASKYALPPAVANEYCTIDVPTWKKQVALPRVTSKRVEEVLEALDENSGTGPDLLPSRMLRQSAKALAVPVKRLVDLILRTGKWPSAWKVHWIVAIYKKNNPATASNYRGIHLTAQLSKAVERIIGELFLPRLQENQSFGENQFAYSKGRGGRDALAYLTLTWILAIARGSKVGVFCSDVSGAFDRVRAERLLEKLVATGAHASVVAVVKSWLENRRANVVVDGERSYDMVLNDMVFQGTVLGPPLWNVFFADAKAAVREYLYEEIVYADDLNAFRVFSGTTANCIVEATSRSCQAELRKWGAPNQVQFDASKESHHILSRAEPSGDDFKLLGVTFDSELFMARAVSEVVIAASWRLTSLLRTRRYYSVNDLMKLYKSQILSLVEHRTPAIHHATSVVLRPLDNVQGRLLRELGITEKEALLEFNLAPLACRRDIAMLGLVHRAFRASAFSPTFRGPFQ